MAYLLISIVNKGIKWWPSVNWEVLIIYCLIVNTNKKRSGFWYQCCLNEFQLMILCDDFNKCAPCGIFYIWCLQNKLRIFASVQCITGQNLEYEDFLIFLKWYLYSIQTKILRSKSSWFLKDHCHDTLKHRDEEKCKSKHSLMKSHIGNISNAVDMEWH